jgi:DNA polymerase I-like protein with 3'-5' exonuclease and polymerase domains
MTQYKIVTLETVKQALNPATPCAFDTETNGLYGSIALAQFYQQHWPEPLLVHNPSPVKLKELLTAQPLIIHNSHYDITTIQIQANDKAWMPIAFVDTLFISRLRWPKQESFALDDCLTYLLGNNPYEALGIDKDAMQKAKWVKPTEQQYQYAALDVMYLHALADFNDPRLEIAYSLDVRTLRNCLLMQWNGLPVDQKQVAIAKLQNDIALADLDMPINVNSWQQVRPYIGEAESDDIALATYAAAGNERAANVRDARHHTKLNSFLEKFNTPRIYGKFSPSARSGRLTCKDQNLQQLPRALKNCFGTPPSHVFVYADFSQLELRAAAAVIGEYKMAALLKQGADLHAYTREILFPGTDKSEATLKLERQIAKTCNFNLLYGGSAAMLGSILIKSVGVLLEDQELQRLRRKWLALWPSIAEWQDVGKKAWSKSEVWRTALGRPYVGKLMTDQLNIAIQGTGAEVAKIAFNAIMLALPDYAKMVNFIHDSYMIEVPNILEKYEVVAKIVASEMQAAWKLVSEACKIKDIPMPVTVEVGTNWATIESKPIYTYSIE